jgi:hypothetical protein
MTLVPLAVMFVLASAASLAAQVPTEPITAADGRVIVSAEVSATYSGDDPGFFNYTDYEYSALRNLRLGVTAEVRASRRLHILGELRVDHGDHVQPFALYVRVRPWPDRRFDIQAGRIPATFGASGRGSYGPANLVIGTPLAYQYLTSLRPDALPQTSEDLVRMRGRGWLSSFPVGVTTADHGIPIVNTMRSDTGVQVHGVAGSLEWIGAVTTGSLSNPRVRDDNGGRQIIGRVVARPVASIALGASAARGAYVSEIVEETAAGVNADDGTQQAFGVDAEYSTGHLLTRVEMIFGRWRLPVALADTGERDLGTRAALIELRYRVYPGVQLAGRFERLDFADIRAHTAAPVPWEADVRRVELGAGYSIIRNVTVKGSWQRNLRDGGRVRRDTLLAAQIVYWF